MIFCLNITRITRPDKIKTAAMTGTIISAILEILCTPPITIILTRTARIMPV